MAFTRQIKANGRIYLAEVESYRKDGKVLQRVIRYFGRDSQQPVSDTKSKLIFDSSRISGSILALNWVADKIGLFKILGDFSEPILTLVYAHCHNYRSVLKVPDWYNNTDLCRVFKAQEMPEYKLREAIYGLGKMDLFKIQKSSFEMAMAFTGTDRHSVIYDVTNTYFTGKYCKLAKVGLDKEGVRGRRLIQIGLAITKEHGIPIFHQLHPGNTSDMKIFNEAITHLKRFGIRNGIIVYDRGMTSKISILQLSNNRWKVLAGMPLHKGVKKTISRLDFEKIKSIKNRVIQGDTVFYAKALNYQFGKKKGRLIVLLNPSKRATKKEERINTILEIQDRIKNRLPVTSKEKKWFTVENRINTHAIRIAERHDGVCCLFTTAKLSVEEAVHNYFDRTLIEASFQGFKGMLGLRPIRMWLEENVTVHVFICHLAYLLKTTLRFQIDQKRNRPGFSELDELSFEQAFDELTAVYRVYFHDSEKLKPGEQQQSRLITLSKRQDAIIRAISSSLSL